MVDPQQFDSAQEPGKPRGTTSVTSVGPSGATVGTAETALVAAGGAQKRHVRGENCARTATVAWGRSWGMRQRGRGPWEIL